MWSFLCFLALAFAATVNAADFSGVSIAHNPSTGNLNIHWTAAANGASLKTGDVLTLTRNEADAELFDQSELTAAFLFTDATINGYLLSLKVEANVITVSVQRSGLATAFPAGPASIVFALPILQAGCGTTSTYTVAGLGGNTFAGATSQSIAAPACPIFVNPKMTYSGYSITVSWASVKAQTAVNGQVFVLGDATQPLIGFAQATTTVAGWTATVEKYGSDNRFAVLLYPFQAETPYDIPTDAGSVTISITPAAGQCGTSASIALAGANSELSAAVAPVTVTVGACATFTGFTSSYAPANGTLGLMWTAVTGVENLASGPIFTLSRDPDTFDLFDDMALTAVFQPDIPGYTLTATIDDAALTITLHHEAAATNDLLAAFPAAAGSVVVTYVRARQLACGKSATYTAAGIHNVQLFGDNVGSNTVKLDAPYCPRFGSMHANYNAGQSSIYLTWDYMSAWGDTSRVVNGQIFTLSRNIGSPTVFEITDATFTQSQDFSFSVTKSQTSAGGYNVAVFPKNDPFMLIPDEHSVIQIRGVFVPNSCGQTERLTFAGTGSTLVTETEEGLYVTIPAPACKGGLTGVTASYGSEQGALVLSWAAATEPAGFKAGPLFKITRSAGSTADLFAGADFIGKLVFDGVESDDFGFSATITSTEIAVSLTVHASAPIFPATGGKLTIQMPTRQTQCGVKTSYTVAGAGIALDIKDPVAFEAPACPVFNGLTSKFDVTTRALTLTWTGVAGAAVARGHVFTLQKDAAHAVIVDLTKPIQATTTVDGFEVTATTAAATNGDMYILLKPTDVTTSALLPTRGNSITIKPSYIDDRCEETADYSIVGDGSSIEPAAPVATFESPECDPVVFTGFKTAYADGKFTLSWAAATGTVDLYNGTLITLSRADDDVDDDDTMFEGEVATAKFVFEGGFSTEGYTLSASVGAKDKISVELTMFAERVVFPSGAGSIVIDLLTRQMACDEHADFTAGGFRNVKIEGGLTVDVVAPKCPYFTGVAGAYDKEKRELTISWKGLQAPAIVRGHTMTLQHAVDETVAFDTAAAVAATVSVPNWTAAGTHFKDDTGKLYITLRNDPGTPSDFPTTAGSIVLTLPYLAAQCGRTIHMSIAEEGSEFVGDDVPIDLVTPDCPRVALNGFTTTYDGAALTFAWTSASEADVLLSGDLLTLTHKAGGDVLFNDDEPHAAFVFPEGSSTTGYNLIAKLDNTALTVRLAKTVDAGAFPKAGASIVVTLPSRQLSCGKSTDYTIAGSKTVKVVSSALTTTFTAPACPSFKSVEMSYNAAASEITVSWKSLSAPAVIRGHIFSFVKPAGMPTIHRGVVAAGTITVDGYVCSVVEADTEGEFFVSVQPAAGTTALFPVAAGSLTVKLDIPASKCGLSSAFSLVGDGAAIDSAPKITLDTPVCPKLSGFKMDYNPVSSEVDLSWTAATGVAQLRTGPFISLSVADAGKFFDSTATTASLVFADGTAATGYSVSAALKNAVLTFTLTIVDGAAAFPASAGSIKVLAPTHQTACDTGNIIHATGESFIGLAGSAEVRFKAVPCPRFTGIDVAFSQESSEFSFSWTSLPASVTVRGTVFTLAPAPGSPRMFNTGAIKATTNVVGYHAEATLDEATGNIDIGLRAGTFMALGGETGVFSNFTLRAVGEFPTGGGSITVSPKVDDAQCGARSEFTLQDTGANFDNAVHTKVSARGPCYSDSGLTGGEKVAIGVVIGVGVPLIIALICLAMYKTKSGCFKEKTKHFDSSELVTHDYNTAHA